MGDVGTALPDSPSSFTSTCDPTLGPADEMLLNFSSAASVSNSKENYIACTKGPDLLALPLAVGMAVSGTLVNDSSTLTAPFLPGDVVLACLLPPKPVLLSAHQDNLRMRLQTSEALEIPDCMLPEEATAYITALLTAAAILKQELHIPVSRTPNASPDPAGDSGVGTYNHKRILVVGGQTSLGSAMVQLLHRALPDTKVLATCEMEDEKELKARSRRLVGLGASYAVDGSVSDLSDLLPPSVDIIINAVRGEAVREDVMKTLDGMARFIDCETIDIEAAVAGFLAEEPDCVTALHEELLRAGSVLERAEEEEENDGGILG